MSVIARSITARSLRVVFVICLLLITFSVKADPVRIAVAANFKQTLEAILPAFKRAYPDIETQVITGSTGGLYAQIIHGAPYDIFLAADSARPEKLLANKKTQRIFHYATGRLTFWVPASVSQVDRTTLIETSAPIAIANHNTAPYGAAAKQTLANLNIGDKNFVTGSNINQTYQYVESGNVTSGFVALSQVKGRINTNQWWLIPNQYHEPIAQFGALLPDHHIEATVFLEYLLSEDAQSSIFDRGYLKIQTRKQMDNPLSFSQPTALK